MVQMAREVPPEESGYIREGKRVMQAIHPIWMETDLM